LFTFFVEMHGLITQAARQAHTFNCVHLYDGALVRFFEFHSTVSCVNMSKISLHLYLNRHAQYKKAVGFRLRTLMLLLLTTIIL